MISVISLLALTALPKVSVEQLSDGTELLHVRVKDSGIVSLRVVVRSGGAADPPGMAGTAHLLEHLIFHGSYAVPGEVLWNAARAAGAQLNAFTAPDYTYYVLDARPEVFRQLAGNYLEAITNPALILADLENERGVVANESVLRGQASLLWIVDQLLFSEVERGATLIGTRRSREQITREALAKFHAANYLASNISVIVTGDISLEETRGLLELGSRLPPDLPEDRVETLKHEVNLPLKEQAPAPFDVTSFGYEVTGMDRVTCRQLGDLIHLRMMIASQIQRPLATQLIPLCARLRGHDFLFFFSESRSFEGSALPEILKETFAGVTRSGATSKERDILRARGRRAVEALAFDPRALADALVPESALAPAAGEKRRFDAVLAPPKIDPKVLLRAAKARFKENRRVEIRMSPFGG
jgi:hypothetical protein